MTITALHKPADSYPVIAIVPLHGKAIKVGGQVLRQIELRDARSGLTAFRATQAAGGSHGDSALAALMRMSGLTMSQSLAMDVPELQRCLCIACVLAEAEGD